MIELGVMAAISVRRQPNVDLGGYGHPLNDTVAVAERPGGQAESSN
jgi:hypothetical protein